MNKYEFVRRKINGRDVDIVLFEEDEGYLGKMWVGRDMDSFIRGTPSPSKEKCIEYLIESLEEIDEERKQIQDAYNEFLKKVNENGNK